MDWHEKFSRAFDKYLDDERLTWTPPKQCLRNGSTYEPASALVIEIATPNMTTTGTGASRHPQYEHCEHFRTTKPAITSFISQDIQVLPQRPGFPSAGASQDAAGPSPGSDSHVSVEFKRLEGPKMVALRPMKMNNQELWRWSNSQVRAGAQCVCCRMLKLVITQRVAQPSPSSQDGDEILEPSEPGLREMPFGKENFRNLVEGCGLPKSFLRALIRGKSHFSKTYNEDDTSKPSELKQTGYNMRTDNAFAKDLAMAACCNLSTGITYGFLHGHETARGRDLDFLVDFFAANAPFIGHPMLLVGLFAELQYRRHKAIHQHLYNKYLEKSEDAKIHISSVNTSHRHVGQHTKITQDVLGITEKISWLQQDVANFHLRLDAMVESSQYIEKAMDDEANREAIEYGPKLRARLKEMSFEYKNLTSKGEMVKQGCSVVIAAVYNLISQEIALSSKRDSTVLKAIAVLTLTFLPGTYIAILFTMPVVDWASGARPAPNNGFLLYWEITVPVTIIFVLFGVYWLFWESFAGRFGGPVPTLHKPEFQFQDLFKKQTYQINVLH